MTESTCPHCGLVIAADPARAAVWLAEHVARYHPVKELAAVAQMLATNHRWRSTVSVEDAAWLQALGISPL